VQSAFCDTVCKEQKETEGKALIAFFHALLLFCFAARVSHGPSSNETSGVGDSECYA
jgi:hypothetical protein